MSVQTKMVIVQCPLPRRREKGLRLKISTRRSLSWSIFYCVQTPISVRALTRDRVSSNQCVSGSVEPVKEQQWIYDTELEKMVQKEISYVPGLYKIYDEILVNAADNKQRDSTMDCIKIDIDP